jgi:hypothetical protein
MRFVRLTRPKMYITPNADCTNATAILCVLRISH